MSPAGHASEGVCHAAPRPRPYFSGGAVGCSRPPARSAAARRAGCAQGAVDAPPPSRRPADGSRTLDALRLHVLGSAQECLFLPCHLAAQRQPLPVALELALLQVRAVACELLQLPLLRPLRLPVARLPLKPPARLRQHGGPDRARGEPGSADLQVGGSQVRMAAGHSRSCNCPRLSSLAWGGPKAGGDCINAADSSPGVQAWRGGLLLASGLPACPAG